MRGEAYCISLRPLRYIPPAGLLLAFRRLSVLHDARLGSMHVRGGFGIYSGKGECYVEYRA